jgi:hypothetical protein
MTWSRRLHSTTEKEAMFLLCQHHLWPICTVALEKPVRWRSRFNDEDLLRHLEWGSKFTLDSYSSSQHYLHAVIPGEMTAEMWKDKHPGRGLLLTRLILRLLWVYTQTQTQQPSSSIQICINPIIKQYSICIWLVHILPYTLSHFYIVYDNYYFTNTILSSLLWFHNVWKSSSVGFPICSSYNAMLIQYKEYCTVFLVITTRKNNCVFSKQTFSQLNLWMQNQ